MFTQTEIISPLLSKKEYIALEIAKALIADKQVSIIGVTQIVRQACNAASQLIKESVHE
jgi:hypothetical protein